MREEEEHHATNPNKSPTPSIEKHTVQRRKNGSKSKASERASGAYVFELEEAEVAEVGDGEVRGLRRDDDLHQLHRLRPHQIHRRAAPAAPAARHGRRSRSHPTKPTSVRLRARARARGEGKALVVRLRRVASRRVARSDGLIDRFVSSLAR